jgi:hypothetical protein
LVLVLLLLHLNHLSLQSLHLLEKRLLGRIGILCS